MNQEKKAKINNIKNKKGYNYRCLGNMYNFMPIHLKIKMAKFSVKYNLANIDTR